MTVYLTDIPSCRRIRPAFWRGSLCAVVLMASLGAAAAQDSSSQRPAREPAPASTASPTAASDFFGSIGRWLDGAFSSMGNNFKDAKSSIDNFNREAGVAAKSTADAAKDVAKDAADAVARLPNTTLIRGHQNCPLAANGAPDCVAAANAMCKAKGFGLGKSVDTTAAEECPTAVVLGRRAAAPGECRTVTFVTRAVCQ